jgi:Flp pilus assembly protein CpaB
MRRKASRASRRLTAAAVVLALAGGLAFQRYAADLERRARPGGPLTTVIVAARELPRGHAIEPRDVEASTLPRDFVPPGAVTSAGGAVGLRLLAPIAEGEPLTRSRLGPPGGPVAALVPPGMRAVSVTTSLPAGTVAVDDRVDVLATFATGAPHTETVVADAPVLSVLRADDAYEGAGLVLLLLVSPEDAERLAYARAFADLSVAIAPGG